MSELTVAPSGLFINDVSRGPVRVYGVTVALWNDVDPPVLQWSTKFPLPESLFDIREHE